MDVDPIVRLPEVVKMTGLARSTLYDKFARGEFPKPVKLGQRAIGWHISDISKWLVSLKGEARHV